MYNVWQTQWKLGTAPSTSEHLCYVQLWNRLVSNAFAASVVQTEDELEGSNRKCRATPNASRHKQGEARSFWPDQNLAIAVLYYNTRRYRISNTC